eukprot:2459703-Lingulodinium_polyedra.AAC.1
MQHAAADRESLAGATMVDAGITCRLMNELADQVLRQHLRNALLGAQWRGDALSRAGLADDALCPFCRDERDGLRHRW